MSLYKYRQDASSKPAPPKKQLQRHTSVLEFSAPRPRSIDTLSTLPSEIILQILSHLGPVTSTCLGLVSWSLYLHHFSVHGKVDRNEITVYTVEMEDNYWRIRGSAEYKVCGPLTLIVVKSLGDILREGGGMEWDGSRGWFRLIKDMEEEKKEKERRVQEIEEIQRKVAKVDECIGAETERVESCDGDGADTPNSSEGEDIRMEEIEEAAETNLEQGKRDGVEAAVKLAMLDGNHNPRLITQPIRQSTKPDRKRKCKEVEVVETKRVKLD